MLIDHVFSFRGAKSFADCGCFLAGHQGMNEAVRKVLAEADAGFAGARIGGGADIRDSAFFCECPGQGFFAVAVIAVCAQPGMAAEIHDHRAADVFYELRNTFGG